MGFIMLQKLANTTLTNKWWSIPLFLLLIIITCLVIWAITSRLPVTVIRSQDGIWDLRDVDFESACIQMSGEVEYVPGALLLAEDCYFEIVSFVNDFGSKLYVNGKWLTDSGLPASTKGEEYPLRAFCAIYCGAQRRRD